MNTLLNEKNNRILIIDDNVSIHEDIQQILRTTDDLNDSFKETEAFLFGETETTVEKETFKIDSAYQGQEGLKLVEKSLLDKNPYALALIDVRMPPGWDGIKTARHIWEACPDTQIIICTAYSDYSWETMIQELKNIDKLVVLKKPFGHIELLQLAHAMTEKWNLSQQAKLKMEQLEKIAEERSIELNKRNAILQAEIEHHKLTEKKLEDARKVTEAAMNARSEFLAKMSHELRTPLNGIIGLSELIIDDPSPAEQAQRAEAILESGCDMLKMVNEILDFSKIDANKFELESIPFDVELLFERLNYVLQELVRKKDIKLNINLDDQLPKIVNGDPIRLRQVILNLASNAIKFTDQGEVNICCSLEETNAMYDTLHFEVKDDGIGISPEAQKNLFQPFVQADSSTTRKYGGTGLGLSICQKFVNMWGGEISIESETGKGAIFSFSIDCPKTSKKKDVTPIPIPATAKDRTPIQKAKDTLHKNGQAKVRRVLVAEDSQIGQKTIGGQLRSLEVDYTIAANGKEALEKVKTEHYDLVLMDCQMPEMDGYTTARAIRALPDKDRASIKIIALTANCGNEARENCENAGMDDYIEKPVRLKKLLSVLSHSQNE